jgi:hypothetical protein
MSLKLTHAAPRLNMPCCNNNFSRVLHSNLSSYDVDVKHIAEMQNKNDIILIRRVANNIIHARLFKSTASELSPVQ